MSARRGRMKIAALITLVATGILLAQEEKPAPEKPPRIKPISLAGNAKAGEKVYLEACWGCHGLSGDGRGPASGGMTPPPTDFTSPGAFRVKADDLLLDAILKGRPGTAMYPQGVDPQSAVDVMAYLKTLIRTPGEEKNFLEALARGDRESGRTIYNARCWPCHGPTGRGNGPAALALRPPPADFTDPDRVPARTSARLYAALSRGVPGTAMAAQSLSEKEKWDVIAYLRTLVRYADRPSAEEAEKPQGNSRAGKEMYDRRCWACHGASGDGNGPAADAMIPPPTPFADYEAMKTRSPQDWLRAIQSGVPGTAMYPQRLTEPEAWDLVAYLLTLGRKKPNTP